jgi:hypothetical protein
MKKIERMDMGVKRTLFTSSCIICGGADLGRGYDALMGEALEMVNALSR